MITAFRIIMLAGAVFAILDSGSEGNGTEEYIRNVVMVLVTGLLFFVSYSIK